MQCTLERESTLDKDGIRGYRDQDCQPWLVIKTKDEREIIVSNRCLLTQRQQGASLKQPDIKAVHALDGVYRNAITPDAHPTFTFKEEGGKLFIREGTGKVYPCLYIPEKKAWVNAMMSTMQLQFPENPDESPLMITDIFSGDQELPKECHRVRRI